MILSRGARLCEAIIRCSRARQGGVRYCGRPYLARRLGCSTRQVSRYVAELADAGRLHVTPPRKVRTPKGWRTVGVNCYRLTRTGHPAPHVQDAQRFRRSGRDDTHVTPPLAGSDRQAAQPAASDLIDPSHAAARLLALIQARARE